VFHVSDQDHSGREVNGQAFAEKPRAEIVAVLGGLTSYEATGDYAPVGEAGLVERTVVLKSFMPTVLSDGLRLCLVNLLVEYGCAADQDVVLVEIASHAYWLQTGLLRGDVGGSSNGASRNGSSRNGARTCSTAS
jgi:hypothetical protein